MLDLSRSYLDKALERVRDRLNVLVERETLALIMSWEKRYPRYEFQIGFHDLGSFRYRVRGDEDWVELDHYVVERNIEELIVVACEADEFSSAWCDMDTRFGPSCFGFIGVNSRV